MFKQTGLWLKVGFEVLGFAFFLMIIFIHERENRTMGESVLSRFGCPTF